MDRAPGRLKPGGRAPGRLEPGHRAPGPLTVRHPASGRLKLRPQFTPVLDTWPDAGVYQLWVRLRRSVDVRVGSLGRLRLAAGTYVYTGRAARALRARVLRHAHGGRRRHWHIDYLLANPAARVLRIVLASMDPADECRVNRAAPGAGWRAVPRFGASDCRSGCPAHLWRLT